jgi:hypothetical protein
MSLKTSAFSFRSPCRYIDSELYFEQSNNDIIFIHYTPIERFQINEQLTLRGHGKENYVKEVR